MCCSSGSGLPQILGVFQRESIHSAGPHPEQCKLPSARLSNKGGCKGVCVDGRLDKALARVHLGTEESSRGPSKSVTH